MSQAGSLLVSGGGGGGTVVSVSGTLNRITSTGGTAPVIDIAATYVGQTSLTTLGTVTTGTWNGTVIGPTFGGTGQSTYTTGDILYASAANTLSKLPIGTTGQVLSVAGGIPAWAANGSALSGTGTTTDATPTTILTFPLNTNTGPGTYLFDFHSVAYNTTDGLSAGYETQFVVRWTTVAGVLISPQDFVTIEETTMSAADIAFTIAGANMTVVVTGLAGKTIDWLTTGSYVFID